MTGSEFNNNVFYVSCRYFRYPHKTLWNYYDKYCLFNSFNLFIYTRTHTHTFENKDIIDLI